MVVDAVSLLNHLNLKNEMSKQKAFVRYTKNGQIIPGSLVLSYNYPKPGLWAEVITDICCDTDIPGTITTTPKAWVRYTKEGKIVPGSLVVGNSYPNSGIWKEVIINLCCATPVFPEINICNQIWMDTNWDGTTFRNGDVIPEVTDQSTWEALTTPAWCYYDNDPANGAIYGKLYNWYAVSDSRGLAPVGWRVPTTNDFQTLVDCLGGTDGNGGKLKETGTTHWNVPNTGATNDSGWTGLGGGLRLENNFSDLKDTGIWWSQTVFDSINAYDTFLQSTNADVTLNNQFPKFYGLSVRLIKN